MRRQPCRYMEVSGAQWRSQLSPLRQTPGELAREERILCCTDETRKNHGSNTFLERQLLWGMRG